MSGKFRPCVIRLFIVGKFQKRIMASRILLHGFNAEQFSARLLLNKLRNVLIVAQYFAVHHNPATVSTPSVSGTEKYAIRIFPSETADCSASALLSAAGADSSASVWLSAAGDAVFSKLCSFPQAAVERRSSMEKNTVVIFFIIFFSFSLFTCTPSGSRRSHPGQARADWI